MMRASPKKNVGIFSSLTKFDKRRSTILTMLEPSDGGGGRGAKYAPPPSCATA